MIILAISFGFLKHILMFLNVTMSITVLMLILVYHKCGNISVLRQETDFAALSDFLWYFHSKNPYSKKTFSQKKYIASES